MHQILQELQHGVHEVVQDRQDGTLEMRVKPPSALQLRAARLITQIINERDQVIGSNQTLAKHLTQAQEEIEALKTQLKEANDRINSSPVSPTNTKASDSSNSGADSSGEAKSPEGQAS